MPAMRGRELAEHFKSVHPEGKILFMSGYFDDMAKGGGIQESERGSIQKPVTMIEMSLKVGTHWKAIDVNPKLPPAQPSPHRGLDR